MWGDGKWVFTAGSHHYQSSGEEPVSPILTSRSQVILEQSDVHRPRLWRIRRSLQPKYVHVPSFSPQYRENRMSGWLPPSTFKINSIQCSHHFSYCPTFRQGHLSYIILVTSITGSDGGSAWEKPHVTNQISVLAELVELLEKLHFL